jgi:LPXTG-motif cell wall-anchored protein
MQQYGTFVMIGASVAVLSLIGFLLLRKKNQA